MKAINLFIIEYMGPVNTKSRSGQIMIEYILLFTVIVAVIIYAATAYIQPSVNKLFEDTSTVINRISDDFVSNAYRW